MKTEVRTLIKRLLGQRKPQDQYLSGLPREARELFETIRSRNLTYLSSSKIARLSRICDIVRHINDRTVFIEAGCALGGSAIFLAKRKPSASVLRVYDVFEMIPPPSERDGKDVQERYEIIRSGKSRGLGGNRYYGYQSNLYEMVIQAFKEFDLEPNSADVQLIKGTVQETLEVNLPVLLAHIDVDWFDAVTTCLERLIPHLHPKGFVVIDDYNDWSGCRDAVDEFFKDIKSEYIFDDEAGNLTVAKKSNQWMHSALYSLGS
jgi:O-methyltransferase